MKSLIICMLAFLTAGALTSCSEENTPTTGQEQQNDREGGGKVSFEILIKMGQASEPAHRRPKSSTVTRSIWSSGKKQLYRFGRKCV